MALRTLINRDRPLGVSIPQSLGPSLAALQEDMNRLFDHVYNGAQVRLTDWDLKAPTAPAISFSEHDKAFKVKVELAGMDPKDVDVEITDGVLTIKGEKKEEKEKEGENYLCQEISYGSFYRTIAIPETADPDKAEAKFKNGILTIDVPKKASVIEKLRKLQIKKAA